MTALNQPDLQPLYDNALPEGAPGAWIREAIAALVAEVDQ